LKNYEIQNCDARSIQLDDKSVNCCVTSPPYWALRDYGNESQIGLEQTPDEYVEQLVQVFREVRRVLRDDGTLWLNLGDSYVGGRKKENAIAFPKSTLQGGKATQNSAAKVTHSPDHKLSLKNLIGIPWRVAFALQADGWFLRQDIIWHKPNPMPESVTDRCTKAHEYIFLLSKMPNYYYDPQSIAEKTTGSDKARIRANAFKKVSGMGGAFGGGHRGGSPIIRSDGTRNKRSVWSVPSKPYLGAHFAAYPPDLIRPCILAGCPPGGVVLDPFCGSGTTGEVSIQHGRSFVGVEINPDFIKLAEHRISTAEESSGILTMENASSGQQMGLFADEQIDLK